MSTNALPLSDIPKSESLWEWTGGHPATPALYDIPVAPVGHHGFYTYPVQPSQTRKLYRKKVKVSISATCMGVLCVYMPCVQFQKASGPLELESQRTVSPHVGAESQGQVLWRSSQWSYPLNSPVTPPPAPTLKKINLSTYFEMGCTA